MVAEREFIEDRVVIRTDPIGSLILEVRPDVTLLTIEVGSGSDFVEVKLDLMLAKSAEVSVIMWCMLF